MYCSTTIYFVQAYLLFLGVSPDLCQICFSRIISLPKSKIIPNSMSNTLNSSEKKLTVDVLPVHAHPCLRYYVYKYGKFPAWEEFEALFDGDTLFEFLKTNYPENQQNFSYKKSNYMDSKGRWNTSSTGILAELKPGLVFSYESEIAFVFWNPEIHFDEIVTLTQQLKDLAAIPMAKPNQFSMIRKDEYNQFNLIDFKVRPTELSIATHYNDDFATLHDPIVSFIKDSSKNGILLFHGVPGTGKTNYLRYLISICDTRFIYIPNNLFPFISEPEFLRFITGYPDSVIVLEDCEELIRARNLNENNPGIASILNLGDGLLGDALRLKIICTFNSDLTSIDSALLRKGRLAFRYEFRNLTPEKANQLFFSLGINHRTISGMSLADVYNIQHTTSSQSFDQRKIGFGS